MDMIDPDFFALVTIIIVVFGWSCYSQIKKNEIYERRKR